MDPKPAIAHNLLLQTQEVLKELGHQHRLWAAITDIGPDRTDIDIRNGKDTIICYTAIHNDGISLFELNERHYSHHKYHYTYEDPELLDRWRTNLTETLKDWQQNGHH